MEAIAILITILIVLFLFSAIGHGLWLTGRAILHALFGGGAKPSPSRAGCRGCGAAVTPQDLYCNACGLPQQTEEEFARARHAAVFQQLRHWKDAGQIDEALHARLLGLLNEEQAPQPPAARPAEAPPAPVPLVREAAAPAPAPPAPAAPRPGFTEMLGAFMEESSIRWGELIGGLLIIGCSLALVVSLWSEIAERPALKFGVFMTLTAGLFGLGFYSAHRWKLPTTSRGVLLTSIFLVPLNFLAVTAFGRTSASAGIALAEIASWLLFGGLVFLAARIVAAPHRVWMTAGTMGASLALLAGKHFAPAGSSWRSWLLFGALPAFAFAGSLGAALRDARRAQEECGERTAYGLFTLLATNLFAALLPLALLQLRAADRSRALHEIAPLLALLGLPAAAIGWGLWRGLREAARAAERTIAASVGLCGAGLLAGSLGMAFPLVDSLLAIALLNAAVWSWAARRYGLRPARWAAMAFLTLTYLLGAHLLFTGRLTIGMAESRKLLATMLSYATALLLIPAFALLTGLAEWAKEKGREGARDFSLGGLLCGGAGLTLAFLHGFGQAGDPRGAVWVLGGYAVAAFALAWRRERVSYTACGLLVLLLASMQTFVYKLGWPRGWEHATLLGGLVFLTAAGGIALAGLGRSVRIQALFVRPALLTAWAGAMIAGAAMLAALGTHPTGLTGWYLLPLGFVAAVCALAGWTGSSTPAAVGAALLVNLSSTLGYVLWVCLQGRVVEPKELVRIAQINLMAAAGYALAWTGALRAAGRNARPAWLRMQLRALFGFGGGMAALMAGRLIVAPSTPSAIAQTFGDAAGWATVAALAACAAARRGTGDQVRPSRIMFALLSFGAFAACALHRHEQANWLGFHTLLVAAAAIAWLLLWATMASARGPEAMPRWLASFASERLASQAAVGAALLGAATVLLALRGVDAPGGPWRGICALGAMIGLSLGLGLARRQGAYLYAAGGLACGTLTMWLFGYAHGDGTLLDVAMLNAATLAGMAMLSLALERRLIRREAAGAWPAFHQFAAVFLLLGLGLYAGAGLALDLLGEPPLRAQAWSSGLAALAVAALCLACLWDSGYRNRFVLAYSIGLIEIGVLLDRRNLRADSLLVCAALVLAGYGALAAGLWNRREAFADGLRRLRVPGLAWGPDAGLRWLAATQALLAFLAVSLDGWISLTDPRLKGRLAAAGAALLAPVAVGGVARGPQRRQSQMLALALGLGAAVLASWSWIDPRAARTDLPRLAIFLAWSIGGALLFACLEAAQKIDWAARLGAWEAAARAVLRSGLMLGIGVLGLALFLEWADFGRVAAPIWARALLALLLAALVAANTGFALWQGRDPMDLRPEQRGRYVYAAELFAVLTLAHLRMAAPQLFGGAFKAYWPLLVLGLAFAGVGVSEQLRRRGRLVLAEPLARTGVFLPILPSLGFWLADSQVDYAGVLLGVALFYGLLSVTRHSFFFGLLAALAANGGWWHWLHRSESLGFFSHPQIWLIPAALSVMLAAHLNREQLAAEQRTTIRYTSLMTVYVSSTAEIFLNGVGRSPWLPLALAVLSVGGVLLGILLRVRAYLFLGTAFLLLAVMTMVWHAALSLGWGWLWYLVGIGFGVLILYLFALFERNRQEILGLLDRLKTWQA